MWAIPIKEHSDESLATALIDLRWAMLWLANGLIRRDCTEFSITGKAGEAIVISETRLIGADGLDEADTLESLAQLARERRT